MAVGKIIFAPALFQENHVNSRKVISISIAWLALPRFGELLNNYRQRNAERRAFVHLALHFDFSLMFVDDALRNRQTQSSSIFFRRKKWLEQSSQIFF